MAAALAVLTPPVDAIAGEASVSCSPRILGSRWPASLAMQRSIRPVSRELDAMPEGELD